jgi:hypothetical protein
MNLAGIHEVEDLHHDESIEDESEVPRVGMRLLEDVNVILVPLGRVEAATADSTPDDTVVPLVMRVGDVKGLVIKRVPFLRDEGLTHEDEDDHDNDLEGGLSNDVLLHRGRNDIIVTGVRLTKEKTLIWVFSGQSKRG